MIKRIFTLAAVSFLFCAFLPADDCGMYIATKEGSENELKTYSESDKFQGRIVSRIIASRKTSAGHEIEVSAQSFDKKDKATGTSTYVATCEAGTFMIDLRSIITQEQMAAFKDTKVNITADKLDIPANPTAGQPLKNGSVKVTTESEGPINLNLTINITNRKVAALEDMTVPAGTFKCVKITYDVESKLMFTVRSKVAEWYAKDIGLVRSETYTTKDKLQGYTVLTSKK